MKPKKVLTIFVIVIIIAFAFSSVNMAIKLSDKTNAYLGGLTWHKSLDKGFEQARQEDKPILVYFWAIWCQFCEKFETETLPDPGVTEVLTNDFVLVAIDLDEDRDTANKYSVSYPPQELFLDKNGNIIQRIPGFVEADRFLPTIVQIRNSLKET